MDISDLTNGVVLRHENGNYYQGLGKTKIKTSQGWVDGLIYYRAKREDDNFFSIDSDNGQLYSRPLSLFGDKWKLIRKAPAMNY